METKEYLPLFDPPLSEQRRKFILDTLRTHASYLDWILDLGCGTGSLSQLLVNSCLLSRISHLDCNKEDLQMARKKLEPNWMDTTYLRERPLTLEFFQGDLSEYDGRMDNVDAIIFSEVIEHLHPDTLQKVPQVLFGYYDPKLVIISTPNADFNPNFPTYRPGYLRDPDHQFEWTRSEFEAWCMQAAHAHGFLVHFDGVGVWQQQGVYDGCATQFAVFRARPDRWTRVTKWPVPGTLDSHAVAVGGAAAAAHAATDEGGAWMTLPSISYPWHTDPVPTAQVLAELRGSLDHAQRIPLADFWARLPAKQHFRTLDACKRFLQKERLCVHWEDPGHDDMCVELGTLTGGIIQWIADSPNPSTRSMKEEEEEKENKI